MQIPRIHIQHCKDLWVTENINTDVHVRKDVLDLQLHFFQFTNIDSEAKLDVHLKTMMMKAARLDTEDSMTPVWAIFSSSNA